MACPIAPVFGDIRLLFGKCVLVRKPYCKGSSPQQGDVQKGEGRQLQAWLAGQGTRSWEERRIRGIRRVFFKHQKEEQELSTQIITKGQDEDQWSEEPEKMAWVQSQNDLS